MDSIVKLLKEHPLIMGILFGAPIIILVVVYFIFGKVFSSADYISVVCAVLTYYGTVILATVTLVQNEGLLELERQRAKVEERQLRLNYCPQLTIGGVRYATAETGEIKLQLEKIVKSEYKESVQGDLPEEATWVYISLLNNSSSSAYDVKFYNYSLVESYSQDVESYKEVCASEVSPDKEIVLSYKVEKNRYQTFEFYLKYENAFSLPFYHRLFIMIAADDSENAFQICLGQQMAGDIKQVFNTDYRLLGDED